MAKNRAWIIGASQSLGAHFATRMAAEGWAVTGLGRRPAAEAGLPAEVTYVQADLSVPETLDGLAEKLGDVPELVVYNAVRYPAQSEGPPPLGELEAVFRVNALAPYRLLLDLLGRPREHFCSCVVVNSDAMYHAREQNGVYSASKAALRVLTGTLAATCRGGDAAVSTLLVGPLADPQKLAGLRRVAEQRGVTEAEVVRAFLRKTNTNLVIDALIDFESCYQGLMHMARLGPVANGMMYRLDGGSSGGLV
ncbi:SDR family NAD(P)-dependent oxidoreductase [Streptomyces hoynatensis]|uniref:SDR family oxidoreductase n=1 Tax=Streptomyces hoynatensis TaxID=1141874 RepID=A0A3A9YR96_9ACTN|nr:SDR family oxidoreductase [Streptomyces hoynatensis]RKN38369.1 SDR family oxidoreductase [Streptomyces hoynatensis]